MKKLRITVDGKAYDVVVEVITEGASLAASVPEATPPAAGGGDITSPLAGKVVSIDVAVGAVIQSGDRIATIEAMKMNTFIYAETDGTVAAVLVSVGDMVEEATSLLQLS